MITIEELENMKLYKKPVFLPINKDKKKDSAVYLVTPNLRSTLKTINLPYLINRLYFQSYYMEKNVNYFISSTNSTIEGSIDESAYCNNLSFEDLEHSIYLEALSTEDRNKLKDSEFGIPSLRKYPLNDEHHVHSAIRFFNYVDKEHEQELADNIKKAIIKFNIKDKIKTTKENRFSLYAVQEYCSSFNESATNDDNLLSARYCQLMIKNLVKDNDIIDSISFNNLEVMSDKSIKIMDWEVYDEDDTDIIKSIINAVNNFCLNSICTVKCVNNLDDVSLLGSLYVSGYYNQQESSVNESVTLIDDLKTEVVFILQYDNSDHLMVNVNESTNVMVLPYLEYNRIPSSVEVEDDMFCSITEKYNYINRIWQYCNGDTNYIYYEVGINSYDSLEDKFYDRFNNLKMISYDNLKNAYFKRNISTDTNIYHYISFKEAKYIESLKSDSRNNNNNNLLYFKNNNKFIIKYSGYLDTVRANYHYVSEDIILGIMSELKLDINKMPIINIIIYDGERCRDSLCNDYFNISKSYIDGILTNTLEISLLSRLSKEFVDTDNYYNDIYIKSRIGSALLHYFMRNGSPSCFSRNIITVLLSIIYSKDTTPEYTMYKPLETLINNLSLEKVINIILDQDYNRLIELCKKYDVYDNKDFNILKDISMIDESYNKSGSIDMKYLARHNKYNINKPINSAKKIIRDVSKVVDATEKNPDNYASGEDSPTNVVVPTVTNTTSSSTNNDESDSTKNEALITEDFDLLLEDSKNDPYLKKYFYNDRIKQTKELMAIYDEVKAGAPFIKYTYIDLKKYLNKNIFIDLSFYNELFFKYNNFKLDKGADLYSDLLSRLLSIGSSYSRKTIFIPINDWDLDPNIKMWMYRESINPISIIVRFISNNTEYRIKELFGNNDIIFLSDISYFKVNFSEVKIDTAFINKFKKFIMNIRTNSEFNLDDVDSTSLTVDSKQAIINNITDSIDKKGIDLNDTTKNAEQKELLIDSIDKAAEKSINTDDAFDNLDDDADRIKNLIINLASEEEEAVVINNARSSRMLALNTDFLDKEIKGKTVKDILKADMDISKDELASSSLPISQFNKDWQNLKFINFDNKYSIDADILEILQHLSKVSRPLSVINMEVHDNSTSEDYVDLYTVNLEDYRGKRFTIKFDVPKFKNNKYLILRGNKKTIQSQLFNMPIIKTKNGTCQIISNYKKIFIYRYGALYGKSNVAVDRFLKALSRYEGKDIKIEYGNCSRICNRYELPIDYIDIASQINKITTPDIIFFFNQDELREKYKDIIDLSKGLPYAYNKKENSIKYYNACNGRYMTWAHEICNEMCCRYTEFDKIFEVTKSSTKYLYSKCSIMSTDIPLIVVAAYSEGLTTVLKKGNVEYVIKEKLDKSDKQFNYDYIKFKDGYIVYTINYSSSLLINGLKDCNTEDYELKDINNKSMYVDFLDKFGGRIKADGLDNFYDCMIDPITFKILEYYKLPTDYVSILLHGNDLLADNKFIKHTDMTSKRLRKQELISVKIYKAIFEDAYSSYANQLKHSRNNATFSLKQSAVIDKFMTDSTSSDLSILNALNDVESLNSVTSKGESGMNTDRAYSLDKRTYDESMLNILGMSTGFAGNVGITRQATIDMAISNKYGFISSINGNTDKLSSVKSLTITEALNPMGSTRDDPFRTAMTFIQTAKHAVRTEQSDPLLVTNGADEALPYLTSDIFAFKAKSKGKVIELVDSEYMILEYNDGSKDYVNLSKTVEKNSDGGFYVTMQLIKSNKIKVGYTFKENEIVAYDPESFSNSMGENDNISYNIGTLAKVAILNTNEGFEDSAIVSEKITKSMATKITVQKDITINKNTNILSLIKVGEHVEEGDTIMIFQDAYEDEDVQMLLKNLSNNADDISELGRRTVKSSITGTVVSIKIFRTVEVDDMSDSLKSIVKKYESNINTLKKKLNSYNIDTASTLPATYSLPITGKLKNAEDSVRIEIFLEYYDSLAVGDKIVYDRANKGTIKDIIPTSHHAYTDFRPNEEISAFVNISSLNSRMVTSPIVIGSLNKLMIELDRSCKDILGIAYDDTQI